MPILPPLQPRNDHARMAWAVAGVAGVGAGACALLGFSGFAQPAAASAAAVAVAAAGALAVWIHRPSPPDSAPAHTPATALAEGEEKDIFLGALEALPDPLLIVTAEDPDDFAARRIVVANQAARNMLRIQRHGVLLLSAIRRPEVLEAVDESLFGRMNRSVDFETGGAQDRYWRVWTAPLEGGEGARRYAILLLRDETDARRSERMRADFLANASHELRTPLASLSGFIETLRGHAKDDPAARDKFLSIMSAQAERMGRLTDDLLSLSRIELNEHVPPSGKVDLAMAVSDVADALAPLLKERGVALELDLPPRGEALTVGDRDQLVQVVQNLVDNAIKYSAPGGKVSVRCEAASSLEALNAIDPATPHGPGQGGGRFALLTPDRGPADAFVTLRVSDEGPGMAREHLPRLSERFYRVEGQKSGERSGTGLGLAIVKHIVNRHRGGVWVESALGRGSTFCVYLPRAIVTASPAAETPVLARKPPEAAA
ncbi:MAG: ATP-binding protein [Pseudomonadota bacterium]|jgi:two-component system phosphate regulon sensor histidine kinase PhoR